MTTLITQAHRRLRLPIWAGLYLMCAAAPALAQPQPTLVVRHSHYFVIANDGETAPAITITSKPFFTYQDNLSLQVIDDEGNIRIETVLPVGTRLSRPIPGPVAAHYLVIARPGINGAIFECDRPWSILGGSGHSIGTNSAVPQMYLYIPKECERFTVTGDAMSPREGGRIAVLDPEGVAVLTMDGEFDKPETQEVTVPPEHRGRAWSVTWADPQTVEASLDDIAVAIDGTLVALLWQDRSWAEKYGPELWRRHKAAIGG